MEIIPFNRHTEDTFADSGHISFDLRRRRTRIDTAAAKMLGASKYMFAHFLQFGEEFYLTVNEDEAGYMLTETSRRSGLQIANTKFIRWFFAKQKVKGEKAVFLLTRDDSKQWQGYDLFQIHKLTG